MPKFNYKAIDDKELVVRGAFMAPSLESAEHLLRARNWRILQLAESGGSSGISIRWSDSSGVNLKELVIFSRQLSVLISANVALVQSLRIVAEQTEGKRLSKIVEGMAEDVDAGTKFSDAMGKNPRVFSNFFINVIKSGENSGKLDEVLVYMADGMEKDFEIRGKVIGAMIYPIIVLTAMVVIGLLMVIFIVPKFAEMLTANGAELPIQTKMLIMIAEGLIAMARLWWIFLPLAAGAGILLRRFAKSERGRWLIDNLLLRVPVFGPILRKTYLVRFCRSMNTLIVGGVGISRALEITADLVDNEVYRRLILETRIAVEEGASISTVFEASPEVPKMLSQMMSVGERTGHIDFVLTKVGDFYNRELNALVANLMHAFEPIIILIMAVGVFGLVISILLPMFKLASSY